MDITIGERRLAAHRDNAVDAALVAETGCTVDEHIIMLSKDATSFQIARALRPMLDDAIDLPALALMIGDDERASVRLAVVEQLRAPISPAPQAAVA